VAHNASFDYRILQNQTRYDFENERSAIIKNIPETSSTSPQFVPGIRHRASGDALATVKLFKIFLEKI
jgi:DNA polymerase-3 subunit epsilon